MAEEGARSRDNGGEPGMEGAHTGPSGRDPMGAPDPGEYASGAEVEYDDDIDRDDVDEADFDDEYDEVEPRRRQSGRGRGRGQRAGAPVVPLDVHRARALRLPHHDGSKSGGHHQSAEAQGRYDGVPAGASASVHGLVRLAGVRIVSY